jgi:hypothetical protein
MSKQPEVGMLAPYERDRHPMRPAPCDACGRIHDEYWRSRYWCPECDILRCRCIQVQLEGISADLAAEEGA